MSGQTEAIANHQVNQPLPTTKLTQLQVPHVVLLPLPLQGPINCFLKLSQLLSPSHVGPTTTPTSPINITFINAHFVHRRLSLTRNPNIRFHVVSDGLPGDEPRPPSKMAAMVAAVEAEVIRLLPKLAQESPPATCLIADGIFTEAGEAAMRLGIPVVYFSTLSPGCVWVSSYLVPKLIDDGDVPFKQGDDMDEAVIKIPGTEKWLRRCDLPGICRARADQMSDPYNQLIIRECIELPNAQGHILNTFDDLEGPLLSHLHSLFPNLYTIGPLHLHLKTRLQPTHKLEQGSPSAPNCSLWPEDRTCLAWLDAQPSKSVVFVSTGSLVLMTTQQLMEFWHGLVNSGVRFLWVQRSDSVMGLVDGDEDRLDVPEEVLRGTEERGFIVRWAPQEEVLAHRAIGGFLTHSGWNSTLESVVEGVPMLCWPIGIDQLVISRFVEQVWGIGIDMKDKCDRVVIEAMVRDLIGRRGEFSANANLLSKSAHEAVVKGGSSWSALDRLIEDITSMRLQIPNGKS